MSANWPAQDVASMIRYYGNVGENQVPLALPYPMRLAWDPAKTVQKIMCHEAVHESLARILVNIFDHYGGSIEAVAGARMDLFGGCLNVRKIRGGDSWSIHSWGAAIDLDPDNNAMSMHRNGATMPEEVIRIFKGEGWISMGDARNFDYMHFQAASL